MGEQSDSVITDSNKNLTGYMEWKYALAKLITSNCKVINVSMGLTKPDADVSMEQGNILGSFLDKMLHKGYDFVIVQSAGNSIKNESTQLYETTNAINTSIIGRSPFWLFYISSLSTSCFT